MVQPLVPTEEIGKQRRGIHAGGRHQKYVLSDACRRILLERYDGRTATLDDLMRYFPGVPRWCVRKWACDLGLARRKEPLWTEEEVAFLERNLHKKRIADIARHLGRTQTAVKIKARRLGVNKTQEGYTLRGLCLGLGVDHHKVYGWVERGWLIGHRRQTDRPSGDIWWFTDAAIRKLVVQHPCEIDPRRADWLWLVDLLAGGLGSLAKEREA